MGKYDATVRLVDHHAAVCLGSENLTVAPCKGTCSGGGCPVEHVVAALGSCIVLTLSAVAEHKKIRMEKLEVQVGCQTANGASASTRFNIQMDVGGGLTPRERAILLNSARNCEVGKILTGPIDIEYC